jgi:hypothetical protein
VKEVDSMDRWVFSENLVCPMTDEIIDPGAWELTVYGFRKQRRKHYIAELISLDDKHRPWCRNCRWTVAKWEACHVTDYLDEPGNAEVN